MTSLASLLIRAETELAAHTSKHTFLVEYEGKKYSFDLHAAVYLSELISNGVERKQAIQDTLLNSGLVGAICLSCGAAGDFDDLVRETILPASRGDSERTVIEPACVWCESVNVRKGLR